VADRGSPRFSFDRALRPTSFPNLLGASRPSLGFPAARVILLLFALILLWLFIFWQFLRTLFLLAILLSFFLLGLFFRFFQLFEHFLGLFLVPFVLLLLLLLRGLFLVAESNFIFWIPGLLELLSVPMGLVVTSSFVFEEVVPL
jgi:hypothetical protein